MRAACPQCSSGQKDIGGRGQKVGQRVRNQKASEKGCMHTGYRINMPWTNHMHIGSYSGRALGTLKPPQTFDLRQFHA